MQMEWADKQPHECIIAAPLAVAHQFVREAEKFGIDSPTQKIRPDRKRHGHELQRLENFFEQFGAVALDESNILKNSAGAYRTWMIDAFRGRRSGSALPPPAPNDVMELGTQAEFRRNDSL